MDCDLRLFPVCMNEMSRLAYEMPIILAIEKHWHTIQIVLSHWTVMAIMILCCWVICFCCWKNDMMWLLGVDILVEEGILLTWICLCIK